MKFVVIEKTWLRQEPDDNAPIVCEMEKGEYLYTASLNKIDPWYHVITKNSDQKGWIPGKYLKQIELNFVTDDEIQKITDLLENKWFLSIIEKLKKDGIRVDESMADNVIENIGLNIQIFEGAIVGEDDEDRDLEFDAWKYLLNLLEKDHEDIYKFVLYMIKNKAAYAHLSSIIYSFAEFSMEKYFPEKIEDFYGSHIDYRQVKKIMKSTALLFKKSLGN